MQNSASALSLKFGSKVAKYVLCNVSFITANGERIPFSALQENIPAKASDTERKAAAIIADWLAGKDNFTLHTSGSTGTPKAIRLKRKLIEISVKTTAGAFGLTEDDVLLCCLSLDTIAGFMQVMRAVVLNCDVITISPVASPLKYLPEDIRVDFAAFVPLQLEKMIEEGYSYIKSLNRMKTILVGGAPVSDSLSSKINQRITAPVFQTYGMTETYTHIAIRRINGPFAEEAYCPLKGIKVSTDSRGCLVITSPVTEGKPLVTNDLAEVKEDGSFKISGRWDHVINSGGIKIQLEEVEAAAREFIHEPTAFFAAGIADEKLGQQLVLVVEGKVWPQKKQKELLNSLREKLHPYKAPKGIYFIDKIMMTRSNKIDRTGTLKKLIINT